MCTVVTVQLSHSLETVPTNLIHHLQTNKHTHTHTHTHTHMYPGVDVGWYASPTLTDQLDGWAPLHEKRERGGRGGGMKQTCTCVPFEIRQHAQHVHV